MATIGQKDRHDPLGLTERGRIQRDGTRCRRRHTRVVVERQRADAELRTTAADAHVVLVGDDLDLAGRQRAHDVGREARRQLLGEVVRAWVDEIPEDELQVHYAKAVEELDDDDLSMLAAWHASLEVGQPIANRDFLTSVYPTLGENRREALKIAAGFRGEEASVSRLRDRLRQSLDGIRTRRRVRWSCGWTPSAATRRSPTRRPR